MDDKFTQLAENISSWIGKPVTFIFACMLIVVWISTGPLCHFSNTWQLIVNTGSSIVTFLIVFLIQNTQNRIYKDYADKMDELIKSGEKQKIILLI